MSLMVVLLIMSVVCVIVGCTLFSGKEIGIILIVVFGIIAGASLSAIDSMLHDKRLATAELVKITSKTNLPTTNEYYKVVVDNKTYFYKRVEVK